MLIAEDAPAGASAPADQQAPTDQQASPDQQAPPDQQVPLDQQAPPDEEVPVSALGVPVREGDVLRVPVGTYGDPEWSEAAPDLAARAERLRDAEARLARLRKRDPGGDVAL